MSRMLSYSGLVTKIRAMKSNLLTDNEYRELSEISSVPMAVAWLQQKKSYRQIWASLDENDFHRGLIEKYLTNAVYNDYARLYRFANLEQRKFLEIYFKRYEISILKNCLNKIFDHREVDLDLSIFKPFFDRHSDLDITRLSGSVSIEDFISNLRGSDYYEPLQHLGEIQSPTLFDYETALDLHYFQFLWKAKDKLFEQSDLEQLTAIYGNKFDMLNLQFIHRARKFYRTTPADIYALIIPLHYKLKLEEITAMVEAESDSAYEEALRKTYYGTRFEALSSDTLEDVYVYSMKHILSKKAKEDPYAAATMYQYLYLKDHEVRRLIVALECIRYGLAPEVTIQHVMKF